MPEEETGHRPGLEALRSLGAVAAWCLTISAWLTLPLLSIWVAIDIQLALVDPRRSPSQFFQTTEPLSPGSLAIRLALICSLIVASASPWGNLPWRGTRRISQFVAGVVMALCAFIGADFKQEFFFFQPELTCALAGCWPYPWISHAANTPLYVGAASSITLGLIGRPRNPWTRGVLVALVMGLISFALAQIWDDRVLPYFLSVR